MKNSIEEDIKNAKHFINFIKTNKEYKEKNGWHGYYNKEIVELARILEHILSDYKRVLKENEELKAFKKQVTDIESTNFIKYKNYIPTSLVKEKIEELDKEEKRELKGTKGQDRYYIKQKYMYKRKVLEELLERTG